MRIPLLLGLFLMFFLPNVNAQPPGFTLLPVALNCGLTTPLCDVDSTYNATDATFNANVPPAFCGQGSVGNNAQWIQFYAGTASITFHFDVSNCSVTGQGEGLQIAPWSSNDCQDGTFVLLGPCQDSGGQPTPTYDVVANNMTPGFCYFLLIDGWAGSMCDYELTITNGSTVPPPIVIGAINVANTGTLTTGCPVNFSVPSQGDCVITDWTTTGGFIDEGTYSSNITFTNPGNYTVCFDAQYENTACEPAVQECVNVIVEDAPHTPREETLCPGESITIGGQTFSSSTTTEVTLADQDGCDSIIDLDLTVLSINDLVSNVDSVICKGDSVFVGGNPYWTPGSPHIIPLTSNSMSTVTGLYCDSIVRLTLSVLDPRSEIDPTAGIPCSGDSITLIGTPNFNQLGQTQTLQWYYNTDPIVGANGTTINVANAGEYIFEVTVEKNGFECIATDTVDVTQSVGGVDTNAGADTSVTCLLPTVQLDGSTTDVGNFIYTWTTDTGFIVSGVNSLNPTISEGGCYFLEIFDVDQNCSGFDTTCVTEEVGKPTIVLSPDTVLTCDLTSVSISGVGSSESPTITWTWTGPGLPNGNENNPTISINQGGTYTLTLFDSSNGCPSSGGIVVTMDTISPIAIAGMDTILSCTDTIVPLNSVGSSPYGGIYEYTWFGTGINAGNINDQFPEVEDAGSYVLSIENTENGCTSSDIVEVTLSNDFPIANAGENKILNCFNNISVQIDGAGSDNGVGYNLEWTGPGIGGGNDNQVSPTVSEEGWYYISVTDVNNGCLSIDSTRLSLDTLRPTLVIDIPDTIKCNPDNVLIDASSSFSPIVFDGNAANADTFTRCGGFTPNAFVEITFYIAEAGDYTFEWDGMNDLYGYIYEDVFDPVNPCSNIVDQDDDDGPGLNPLIETYLEPGVYILVTTYWAAGMPTDYTINGFGLNQISYDWSGPDINVDNQNISNPTVGVDGYYYLTLTNTSNGCTETDSVFIAIDTLSPIPLAIGDTLKCGDLNVTLMGSSDLTDVTYFWIDPTGDTIFAINPAVNEVGEYTLVAVNNQTGCARTTTTNVIPDTNAPNISMDGGFLNCDTLMTEVSAISDSFPVIYDWDINGTMMSGPIQTVTDPGTYSVTITNTINNCETFGDVTVDQDIEDPIVVVVADDELDCDTREISLEGTATGGSGTYTYTWTTVDGEFVGETNNSTPRINKPGRYDVQVRDAVSGCVTDAFIIVDENTTYPTPGNVDASNINCYGEGNGTILFQNIAGGIPPYTYSIDNGETYNATPNFFLLDPGQYYINVKDALGCIWNDSVIVDEPQELLVDLGPDYFINLGDSTTLYADLNSSVVESIIWTPSLDSCFTANCTSLTVGPYEPTIYTVTVTDINGCIVTDEVLVKINKERNVFLPTGLYPNSTTGNSIFMVYGEIGQIKNINRMMIFNRWGEKVFENKDFMPNDPTAGWDGSFGGSPMNSAVFMYVVELEYIDGNIEFFKGDVTLVR